MEKFGLPELLFLFGFSVMFGVFYIIPYWVIFKKAGLSPWLSLLMGIPGVGLVVLWVFAFVQWPIERRG